MPGAFRVVAAAAWGVVLGRYLLRAGSAHAVAEDLRHPVYGPFASLVLVVATLFGERLHADLRRVGQVRALVTASASPAFGAWFVSHLTAGGRQIDRLHSGYLLPTLAAGPIPPRTPDFLIPTIFAAAESG